MKRKNILYARRIEDIPKHLREEATVMFLGEYRQRAGPHIPRGSNFYIRTLFHDFIVKEDYIGNIACKIISINVESLPENKYITKEFYLQQEYFILLRPRKHSMRIIKSMNGFFSQADVIQLDEVIAIIPKKK